MNLIENPFQTVGYHGSELFCDRKKETSSLLKNAKGRINTTLVSIRRMGKTALLKHVLYNYSSKPGQLGIYIDIYGTRSLKEFTVALASAIYTQCPEKSTIFNKFLNVLKSLRAVFSFDELTGKPQLTFDISDQHRYEQTIETILLFLEMQRKRILIAIDEFQQIANYPEKNIESVLRSVIQHMKNVSCIFSGSNRHILLEMFQGGNRPFFASTQFLYLGKIEEKVYEQFIENLFNKYGRKISPEALHHITTFTKLHTYYTQSLCSRIFLSGVKDIDLAAAQNISAELLLEAEPVFYQYRTLLTSVQWDLLKAIAKEDKLYNPHSRDFLHKYKLSSSSSIQRALNSLIDKEMIVQESTSEGIVYQVYDCFLSRWLERK